MVEQEPEHVVPLLGDGVVQGGVPFTVLHPADIQPLSPERMKRGKGGKKKKGWENRAGERKKPWEQTENTRKGGRERGQGEGN